MKKHKKPRSWCTRYQSHSGYDGLRSAKREHIITIAGQMLVSLGLRSGLIKEPATEPHVVQMLQEPNSTKQFSRQTSYNLHSIDVHYT